GYREALLTLVDLLTPIIPHFAEEVNETVRKTKDGFASFRPFPKADKKRIKNKLEQEEQLVKNVKEDIDGIFSAIKKQEKKQASKIEVFVAPEWMNKILKIRRGKPENLIKAIMEHDDIKRNGNKAVKYAQKLTKHPGIDSKLNTKSEFTAINDAINYFKREYNIKEFQVTYASKSTHPKANVAEPGRPGIAIDFS
ncbi:MAG: class I tRNA ligase family protein, partial [Candidatus Heimdallarchaeota archaeon]